MNDGYLGKSPTGDTYNGILARNASKEKQDNSYYKKGESIWTPLTAVDSALIPRVSECVLILQSTRKSF